MKLLLDENLPKKLKMDLRPHEVYTTFEKGWSGVTNGSLLRKLVEEGFDALLTFDKNLSHQQNFQTYPISVIVLNASDNTHATLKKLAPQILQVLNSKMTSGRIEINQEM
jgi:predicted nuclease of predicted toxin-antitoxin system